MKIMTRYAFLMVLFLLISRAALAQQYFCDVYVNDGSVSGKHYVSRLLPDISVVESVDAINNEWSVYVQTRFSGMNPTASCQVNSEGTSGYLYDSMIRSYSDIKGAEIIDWTPSAATTASAKTTENKATSNSGNKISANNKKKYRDGTRCVKLSGPDSNGTSYWENHCSFPVTVSWFDENPGDSPGASLNIHPGKKDSVLVKGRPVFGACEYPGAVHNVDGSSWQRGTVRHSCR